MKRKPFIANALMLTSTAMASMRQIAYAPVVTELPKRLGLDQELLKKAQEKRTRKLEKNRVKVKVRV